MGERERSEPASFVADQAGGLRHRPPSWREMTVKAFE